MRSYDAMNDSVADIIFDLDIIYYRPMEQDRGKGKVMRVCRVTDTEPNMFNMTYDVIKNWFSM